MRKNALKIGLPATLTGELSIQGTESFNGINLWLNECRGKGGLNIAGHDKRIIPELVYYDDGSNPQRTRSNTIRLLEEDRVDLLLGPYSSSLTTACIETASRFKRVIWNHGGSSDEIHKLGYSKIISTITEAGKYYEGIIDLILSLEEHNSLISIVRKKASRFSKHVSEGARTYAEKKGLKAVILEFSGGSTQFETIFEQIKNYGTDFIFCVGSATDDINFCRSLINHPELKYKFTATLAASINRFKTELGSSSENFVATSQWEPSIEFNVDYGPSSETFSENFKNEYGYLPDYTAAQGYNICLVIEKLLETEGMDEMQMLKSALASKFTTFYGNFEVDPSSGKQVGHKMIVVQWQKGEKKIVYPYEISNSAILYSN